MPPRPEGREGVHLGPRAGDTRKLFLDPVRERLERALAARPGKDEVVRRRLESCCDRFALAADDPEALLGMATRGRAERSGDPEDEVVPRLVRKQEWGRLGEEGAGVREDANLHAHSSSSTSTAPPATWSPSATCTAVTVAS